MKIKNRKLSRGWGTVWEWRNLLGNWIGYVQMLECRAWHCKIHRPRKNNLFIYLLLWWSNNYWFVKPFISFSVNVRIYNGNWIPHFGYWLKEKIAILWIDKQQLISRIKEVRGQGYKPYLILILTQKNITKNPHPYSTSILLVVCFFVYTKNMWAVFNLHELVVDYGPFHFVCMLHYVTWKWCFFKWNKRLNCEFIFTIGFYHISVSVKSGKIMIWDPLLNIYNLIHPCSKPN